jgi:hypothetical protein
MKRLLILTLLAGTMVVMGGRASFACSCAMGDPRSALAESDAAFVGRLMSKEAPKGEGGGIFSSGEQVTYTFSVERSVKGELGKTVDVEAAVEGASCGIEAEPGQRIGLLLYGSAPQWTSNLCSQMDPDALIRAAGPPPKPESTVPNAQAPRGSAPPVAAPTTERDTPITAAAVLLAAVAAAGWRLNRRPRPEP